MMASWLKLRLVETSLSRGATCSNRVSSIIPKHLQKDDQNHTLELHIKHYKPIQELYDKVFKLSCHQRELSFLLEKVIGY